MCAVSSITRSSEACSAVRYSESAKLRESSIRAESLVCIRPGIRMADYRRGRMCYLAARFSAFGSRDRAPDDDSVKCLSVPAARLDTGAFGLSRQVLYRVIAVNVLARVQAQRLQPERERFA